MQLLRILSNNVKRSDLQSDLYLRYRLNQRSVTISQFRSPEISYQIFLNPGTVISM